MQDRSIYYKLGSMISPLNSEKLKYQMSRIYTSGRSLLYFIESLPLPLIDAAIVKGSLSVKSPPEELRSYFLKKAEELIDEDSRDFSRGYWAPKSLMPETPGRHFRRWGSIMVDAIELSLRKRSKNHKSFSTEASEHLASLPEYYQRNFHYQKDGYLSKQSAKIYSHQVELLFKGMADPMRRIIIRPLKETFSGDGYGLHFLDVACGAGSSAWWLRAAYPKAQITCLDLSGPYLEQAREIFRGDDKINFIQGMAEDLPFKENSFDAVLSTFLFHEVPLETRQQILKEKLRVAKSMNSFVGLVDSIQLHDDERLKWSLEQFPREFHEPFYKNYIKNPLEDSFPANLKNSLNVRLGFYSKSIWLNLKEH